MRLIRVRASILTNEGTTEESTQELPRITVGVDCASGIAKVARAGVNKRCNVKFSRSRNKTEMKNDAGMKRESVLLFARRRRAGGRGRRVSVKWPRKLYRSGIYRSPQADRRKFDRANRPRLSALARTATSRARSRRTKYQTTRDTRMREINRGKTGGRKNEEGKNNAKAQLTLESARDAGAPGEHKQI